MASPCKLLSVALLLAMMTSCVVHTAPTGVLEELQEPEKFQEVVEEAGKQERLDEALEKESEEDDKIGEVEETVLADDGKADGEEEIVQDAEDEVVNDSQEAVINDEDTLKSEDVIITGSSSQPDAGDYFWGWEPSYEYDSADTEFSPWFVDDIPQKPSYYPGTWSSYLENFDGEYFPNYGSSYEGVNVVDNNLDNSLKYDIPEGLFDGIPGEELNNKVDQTVDEFLCMLGLCDDVRVYPEDEEWEQPNEIQFTEEGMMGNSGGEEDLDEKNLYTVDAQPEADSEEAANSTTNAEDDSVSSSRIKRDAPSSPEESRHRSKRDLSWDDLDRDNDLLSQINSLEGLQEEAETARDDPGQTTADRFEDLLEYFKEEAAENEIAGDEEFFLGVPESVLNEIAADTTGGEFQNVIEEEEEEEGGEDVGIEETGEFLDKEGEVDQDEDDWGAYLTPGSPYSEDTLRYDGYKRDDEREALRVYIESLQNLEGYRKRDDQRDYLEDGSRSAENFLRQLVPRSPPNAIRYPKTGLEPFSREKYFPLFPEPGGLADDDEMYPDPDGTLKNYNELLDLFNTELEATVLISTIQEMAAELGRDRRLLVELEEEEAEMELQLALDKNNREILDLVGVGNIRPMKRAPRIIDYPDFNEYPPEFHRSATEPQSETNGLSEDELVRLYTEYLNEAAEEAKWGDFIYQPRERREGEDNLPGPYAGYYVQGRMLGDLMKPKRTWEPSNDDVLLGFVADTEMDQPYVLVEPSDLGYDEWPGDFEIFYDMRDGTYILYPYPQPQDARVLSDEALLDALGVSGRNFVTGGDEDGNDGAGEEEWGDFKDDADVIQREMKDIDADIDELEDLQLLAEIAKELQTQDDQATEEENLFGVLLGK